MGPIPKNQCVLHKCDVTSCVNPKHLFLGSRADNNVDMAEKGRANRKPNDHPAYFLSDADVRKIRKLASKGNSRGSIARTFGITVTHVSNIVKGKSRRDA